MATDEIHRTIVIKLMYTLTVKFTKLAKNDAHKYRWNKSFLGQDVKVVILFAQ